MFNFRYYLAALYLVVIATTIALVGQHLVRKAIAILGRASVIIFILTLTLSVSVVLFGKYYFLEHCFVDILNKLFIFIRLLPTSSTHGKC
ncbi:hypothetical protein AAZV13_10G098900 [Glycine max]